LPGAIKVTQDRGFFFRETNLAALRRQQKLRARPERVRPDHEHGVLARLVLAKLRANAREQHSEAERLGDVIVGAGLKTENGVAVSVVAGQHDDRRLEAGLTENFYGFAAVHVRQADVHNGEVDLAGFRFLQTLGAGLDRNGVEFLVQRQLLDQRGAQLVVVLNDQNRALVRHCPLFARLLTSFEHPAAKAQGWPVLMDSWYALVFAGKSLFSCKDSRRRPCSAHSACIENRQQPRAAG
jgi:hypothetical protein